MTAADPGPSDPPPPSWLRGAGLGAYLATVAADLYDGRLHADEWALATCLVAVLWGPSVVGVLARGIRGR